ncbi:MAG: response regulator [Desulfocapsaceae bacterium]|nr:response regulator [Desulfocapsaceae bacterium]
MKTLIVEDDFTSRLLLQELLKTYGQSHIAVTGGEAVEAVRIALGKNQPYDLICMDIMMPEMDGQQALREIRTLEEAHGIFSPKGSKIIMTTALTEMKDVMNAYHNLCDAYLTKPIQKAILLEELKNLRLLKETGGKNAYPDR